MTDMPDLREASTLSKDAPPPSGWTVIIVTNPVARFFASIASQLAKRTFHIVSSFDEAWAFLQVHDARLPEEQPSSSVF